MSNLTSNFDVLRGWPNGGAIEETFKVKSGQTLVEGLLVKLSTDAAGQVELPTVITAEGAASATAPTHLRMVIQGNDQFDGKFLSKAVTLRGNFTVKTSAFVAGMYTPGQLLTVSVAVNADQGKLVARSGTFEKVVGEVESYDSTNGVLVVSMSL